MVKDLTTWARRTAPKLSDDDNEMVRRFYSSGGHANLPGPPYSWEQCRAIVFEWDRIASELTVLQDSALRNTASRGSAFVCQPDEGLRGLKKAKLVTLGPTRFSHLRNVGTTALGRAVLARITRR